MSTNLTRRLERLEASARPRLNLAAVLERGRQRLRGMTDAQRQDDAASRLEAFQRRHAAEPLRGLSLAILRGLERASSLFAIKEA
jgi:hypothetical protein